MENREYLVFSLLERYFAFKSGDVRGIYPLPELEAIADSPPDMVGLVNIRGEIVPVMDLNIRLTGSPSRCRLSDRLVVIDRTGGILATIVSSVEDVMVFDSERILESDFRRIDGLEPIFIEGIARKDGKPVFLLNKDALLKQPSKFDREKRQEKALLKTFYNTCCPDATPEEREIFHRRAGELAREVSEGEKALERSESGQGLAIVDFSGDYFGISLNNVKEFTKINSIAPIPCCPDRIIGNINRGGELITLIDIRPLLSVERVPVGVGSPVAIVEVEDLTVGLPISGVVDVIYPSAESLEKVKNSRDPDSPEYRWGTLNYEDKILSLLDLKVLLTQNELIVNEKV